MTPPPSHKGTVVFRTARDFCAHYFPRRHTARECDCWPKLRPSKLVIQPRRGRSIR